MYLLQLVSTHFCSLTVIKDVYYNNRYFKFLLKQIHHIIVNHLYLIFLTNEITN